ncbi:MAG: hypothetical protein GEU80_14280 [Dehalococcoidia bacterium]|nr:hypothetical protein [Dehalococcoidia bacterium]
MHQQHSDFVSRSFSDYLSQQRSRITETREQIDQQRLPFLKYAEDQRDTIEVALSRFDDELDELEKNLSEQRRGMTQVLDAMRSESFVMIREFLEHRQDALAQLATSGNTDPGDISRAVRALREAVEKMAGTSSHVKTVLDATDEADARLSKTVPAPSNALPPELAVALEEERTRAGARTAA